MLERGGRSVEEKRTGLLGRQPKQLRCLRIREVDYSFNILFHRLQPIVYGEAVDPVVEPQPILKTYA